MELVAVLSLSVATMGLTILTSMLVAESLGGDLSWRSWIVIVPPVTLLQLVPISLAGWGVCELGVVVLLTGFGIPAEPALTTSLLVGVCLIVSGLPSSLLWLTSWDITRDHKQRGRRRQDRSIKLRPDQTQSLRRDTSGEDNEYSGTANVAQPRMIEFSEQFRFSGSFPRADNR